MGDDPSLKCPVLGPTKKAFTAEQVRTRVNAGEMDGKKIASPLPKRTLPWIRKGNLIKEKALMSMN